MISENTIDTSKDSSDKNNLSPKRNSKLKQASFKNNGYSALNESPDGVNSDEDIQIETQQEQSLTVSAVPVKKRLNPDVTPSFQSDQEKGYVYFQDQNLTIKQNVLLHLKPSNHNKACINLMLFLLDFLMSLTFQVCHMMYFIGQKFKGQNNHILHVLIGGGFTSIILIYCFTDGVRYLRSNLDRALYLICCILQKPILFPILCPTRFRSRISNKHLDTHTFKIQESTHVQGKLMIKDKVILPTNFQLAVQECNFLYSFTSAGFVAFSSAATILIESASDNTNSYLMLALSCVYFIYGSIISVYLYGRKTDHMFEDEKVQ